MAYSEQYKRILHRLGYYNYQQGLIQRHFNQDEGWNSHLNNCRNYILEAVREKKPSRITVLGSGWLLDLPLAELLDDGLQLTLIDIVHPPEAYRQTASLTGVTLIEEDATGGLVEELWKMVGERPFFRKLTSLEGLEVPVYKLTGDPGMVISLNILSQLDVLPVEFLRKKTRIDEDEILRFRKLIQSAHLRFLSDHMSLLITDIAEIFTDTSANTTEVQTVITDLPEGSVRKEWTWDFDLRRSDYYEKRSVMKVIAITFPK